MLPRCCDCSSVFSVMLVLCCVRSCRLFSLKLIFGSSFAIFNFILQFCLACLWFWCCLWSDLLHLTNRYILVLDRSLVNKTHFLSLQIICNSSIVFLYNIFPFLTFWLCSVSISYVFAMNLLEIHQKLLLNKSHKSSSTWKKLLTEIKATTALTTAFHYEMLLEKKPRPPSWDGCCRRAFSTLSCWFLYL